MNQDKKNAIGRPILTSQEMARIEQIAIQEKGQETARLYMETAGANIAQEIINYLAMHKRTAHKKLSVVLLCGKGNNGGDAYVAGQHLLNAKLKVTAFQTESVENLSTLCKENSQKFLQRGGEITTSLGKLNLKNCVLILDGLLGTGFKGQLERSYANYIMTINQSNKTIFSIDIPSGLSEEALLKEKDKAPIIKASKTLFLGLPKIQFFFYEALNFCGELNPIDFGLEPKYETMAKSEFLLIGQDKELKSLLPKIQRTTHKHKRGACFIWAGSQGMLGAALLASKSCYRSGCGLVTLLSEFTKSTNTQNVLELITNDLNIDLALKDPSPIIKKINQNNSCLIGPGLGTHNKTQMLLELISPQIKQPLVLDADALNIFSKKEFKLPDSVVMTPHLGELTRLLDLKEKPTITEEFIKSLKTFVQEKKVTLVVKGAPTFIISPSEKITIYAGGDPGMATAGSGDVLAGVIVSLLAQGLSTYHAACLGVFLHGEAGSISAQKKSSYSLIASDIINSLPDIYQKLLQ